MKAGLELMNQARMIALEHLDFNLFLFDWKVMALFEFLKILLFFVGKHSPNAFVVINQFIVYLLELLNLQDIGITLLLSLF